MDAAGIAAVLSAIAWPLVVIGGLITFRKPIAQSLEVVSRRATSLDLRFVVVALRPDVEPNWNVAGTDIRRLTDATVFDTSSQQFFTELSRLTSADSVNIDLGEGRSWLSSRLYLFSALARMCGVRCLVIQRRVEGRSIVMGCARPEGVCEALAHDEPWLEAAFLSSIGERLGSQTTPGVEAGDIREGIPQPFGIRTEPDSRPKLMVDIARTYVGRNQRSTPPPAPDAHKWLEFTGPTPRWERARWLRPEELPRSLVEVVDHVSVVVVDVTEPEERTTRRVLLQEGPFAALTNADGTLRMVADREAMLDEVARQGLKLED
jgi:hypothetical protein